LFSGQTAPSRLERQVGHMSGRYYNHTPATVSWTPMNDTDTALPAAAARLFALADQVTGFMPADEGRALRHRGPLPRRRRRGDRHLLRQADAAARAAAQQSGGVLYTATTITGPKSTSPAGSTTTRRYRCRQWPVHTLPTLRHARRRRARRTRRRRRRQVSRGGKGLANTVAAVVH
jgi:hypothetical protein